MPDFFPPVRLVKFHTFVIPKKIKLMLICVIILTSYLSGQFEFHEKSNRTTYTLNEVEKMLDHSREIKSELVNSQKGILGERNASNVAQIKQILIGQARHAQPTPFYVQQEETEEVWGVARKIDTYTYTMRVKPDDTMATPEEILDALNNYRQQHGRGKLSWDGKLAEFADSRADYFIQTGTLDSHRGFLDYLNNQDGFTKLGFSAIGENSSYGFILSGVHLIEWVYAGDEEHDSNQLNSEWQYAGIGVRESATNIIFAASKM